MDPILPKKPERPLDSDCCGQGCTPCVLDIYDEDLKIWERECAQIISGKVDDSDPQHDKHEPVLSVTEYQSFPIEDVTRETHDTNRYRFTLPTNTTLGLQTGQHINVRGEVAGEVITRQYTPISHVNTNSYFELLIKVYKTGKMSQYVKTWEVGTKVQIRGPVGHLKYKQNQYKKLYMLAVGTGIAPICQVIQTVLTNEDDDTLIQVLYGCKMYSDILLHQELTEWSRYWNFAVSFFLSQETADNKCSYRYGEDIHHAKIGLDHVRNIINDPQDNILVLICGTRDFEKDMLENMEKIGVPKDKYHKF